MTRLSETARVYDGWFFLCKREVKSSPYGRPSPTKRAALLQVNTP